MERLFFLTDAACDCDVNGIDLPRLILLVLVFIAFSNVLTWGDAMLRMTALSRYYREQVIITRCNLPSPILLS